MSGAVAGDKPNQDWVEQAEEAQVGTEMNYAQVGAEKNHAQMLHGAKIATEVEHQLTTREAFKVYKKAVFWSVIVSMGIIMDSYDSQLMGNFYALPEFQRQFGQPVGTGYQITSEWQEKLSMCGSVGNIIGVWASSYFCEKFGCKRVLLVSYLAMDCLIFLLFFAPNIQALLAGALLYNIPIGVFTVLAVGYASELCPVVLRGYLEVYVLLSWATGQLIAFGVIRGFANNTTEWAWRIPYAIQWVWPVIFFIVMLFGPDSPWWQVRSGRIEDARKTLSTRLMSPSDKVSPDEVLSMIIRTVEVEREITAGTRFIDMFSPKNLRRTEVVFGCWIIQSVTGWVVTAYFAYFYEQAGLPTVKAFDMELGQGGLGFICACFAFVISGKISRRTHLMIGMVSMTVLMFLIAILSCAKQNTGLGYGESVLALVWWGVFQLTAAPATYVIIGETAALSVRQKTIGVGRIIYNVLQIVNALITPQMLNPGARNWKGKSAFLPAILNFILIFWAFFRVPECKNRTFEELDVMFERGVPARQFKTYECDLYADVE